MWFAKLREHGPLSSSFLLAYSKSLRRNDKRAQERLTDLFHEDNTPDGGPYLIRPPQQFRTLDSRYNQLVYDLAPAGENALRRLQGEDLWQPKRAGPWTHKFMVASTTASVELATLARHEVTYIPQSAILERAGTEPRFMVSSDDPVSKQPLIKDLVPDALFGLEYHTEAGSRFRFFALEADRATEPATSRNFKRKSFQRNLAQYQSYVGDGLYKDHLRLTAPMMVLNVVTDRKRLSLMLQAVDRHGTRDCAAFMLFQTWGEFGLVFRPPNPNVKLLEQPWQRASLEPFFVDRSQS